MTVREQWLLLGVASAIVLGAGVLIWRGNAQPAPLPDTFTPRPGGMLPGKAIEPSPTPDAGVEITPPAPPEEPEQIGVGVLGAVENAGLYYFEPGARVQDLLEAAGGALPESDLSDINRTALLINETTLLVPQWVTYRGRDYSDPPITYNPAPYTRSAWYRLNEASAAAGSPEGASAAARSNPAASGRININTASQSELETLPGIGPVTAQKIIAYRQQQRFNDPGDLENVSGIGPAKMAAVRGLIAVD